MRHSLPGVTWPLLSGDSVICQIKIRRSAGFERPLEFAKTILKIGHGSPDFSVVPPLDATGLDLSHAAVDEQVYSRHVARWVGRRNDTTFGISYKNE